MAKVIEHHCSRGGSKAREVCTLLPCQIALIMRLTICFYFLNGITNKTDSKLCQICRKECDEQW